MSAEGLRLEARAVPIDRVLEALGAAVGFSVSARCGASGCPTLTGRMAGRPEQVVAWVLKGHNHAILYRVKPLPGARTMIERVTLIAPGARSNVWTAPNRTAPDRSVAADWQTGPDRSPLADPLDDEARGRVLAALGLDLTPLLTGKGAVTAEEGGPFVAEEVSTGSDGSGVDRDALLQALPLIAPLARYRPTSGFGPRRDPLNGRPAHHEGLDLAAPPEAPVRATAPGVVRVADWRGQYGRMVEIDHGFGIRTRYAHLSRLSVRPGQRLPAGETVGVIGRSGRTAGLHLHYEVLLHGAPTDPAKFLEAGRTGTQD